MTIKLSNLRAPLNLGSNHFNDLADVNIPTPLDGQIVVYDFGTAKWVAVNPSSLFDPSADVKVISTVSYTLLADDNGKELVFTNAANVAVDMPDTFSLGWNCVIIQAGAGTVTMTPSGTDTVNGALLGVGPSGQWKGMYVLKYSATEFLAQF